MNTRDMECFCVITREQSISKASKILYMSPQGLSKIIKNLENELDARLMIRTNSGIELTESGKCFYERVQRILSDFEEMKSDILHIEQRYAGDIDLLSAYGILRLVTPECINQFRKDHPEIGFTYREYPDCEVERKFLQKDGNVAFSIGPFQNEVYDKTELVSFPMKLLVNQKHPLAQRSSVTIEDLKGEKLYIESSEFKLHHIIVDKCKKAGFEPNIVFETSGFSLCHKMCRENKGISVTVDFVSQDLSGADLAGENLELLPFSDGDYQWTAYMLTRKGEQLTPEMKCFHRHVSKWLRDIREGVITR